MRKSHKGKQWVALFQSQRYGHMGSIWQAEDFTGGTMYDIQHDSPL